MWVKIQRKSTKVVVDPPNELLVLVSFSNQLWASLWYTLVFHQRENHIGRKFSCDFSTLPTHPLSWIRKQPMASSRKLRQWLCRVGFICGKEGLPPLWHGEESAFLPNWFSISTTTNGQKSSKANALHKWWTPSALPRTMCWILASASWTKVGFAARFASGADWSKVKGFCVFHRAPTTVCGHMCWELRDGWTIVVDSLWMMCLQQTAIHLDMFLALFDALLLYAFASFISWSGRLIFPVITKLVFVLISSFFCGWRRCLV